MKITPINCTKPALESFNGEGKAKKNELPAPTMPAATAPAQTPAVAAAPATAPIKGQAAPANTQPQLAPQPTQDTVEIKGQPAKTDKCEGGKCK